MKVAAVIERGERVIERKQQLWRMVGAPARGGRRGGLHNKKTRPSFASFLFVGFYVLLGVVFGITLSLNFQMIQTSNSKTTTKERLENQQRRDDASSLEVPVPLNRNNDLSNRKEDEALPRSITDSSAASRILQDKRILIAIAAYDFSQRVFLEEVLDGYHDLCVAGAAQVDVVLHATVAYPVTLLDLWNTRFDCPSFQLTIALKPSSLRLHLVDCHRTLFYERINQYDLFIYTEDDMKVRPSTVATYLLETLRIQEALEGHPTLKPSDFNVGIVRYEYNFPTNVIMDDKTRHITQNVTRVYWEHSKFKKKENVNVVPGALSQVVQDPPAMKRYITMENHHQGMFMATPELLQAWKERPKCAFDRIRDRPGSQRQPSQGTQRVWMSSHMLHGKQHCGVVQLLPLDSFGALTILHLPNKNYRRVGKYTNRTFSDGTEVFEMSHDKLLLNAMELHIAMRAAYPMEPQRPYRGIRMIDEVDVPNDRTPLLERRMKEYESYVKRGGVLSEYDMTKTELIEQE